VLGRNQLDRLEPLQVSWGYDQLGDAPDERDEWGSTPRIRALEMEGTRDVCPWLVAPDAIEFHRQLGFADIRGRMAELSRYVVEQLDGRFGLKLTTPNAAELRAAMTAFWIDLPRSSIELRELFWKHRIEVPVMDWPDGRMIRLSTHFYTMQEEIDRFVKLAASW
jgi:isopenicillin-N epimerase